MQAIPTNYKSIKFRSRMEARFASMMDTVRVRWEYEREAYMLDGKPYLPDFWLPESRTIVEIKGVLDAEAIEKADRLARKLNGIPPRLSFGLDDEDAALEKRVSTGVVVLDTLALDEHGRLCGYFAPFAWGQHLAWLLNDGNFRADSWNSMLTRERDCSLRRCSLCMAAFWLPEHGCWACSACGKRIGRSSHANDLDLRAASVAATKETRWAASPRT